MARGKRTKQEYQTALDAAIFGRYEAEVFTDVWNELDVLRVEVERLRAENERLRDLESGVYRNPGPHTPLTTFLGMLPAGYFDDPDDE
jgi:hypothetical protein